MKKYDHPAERRDFLRRLRDRVAKLGAAGEAIEKVLDTLDYEITAIRRRSEYKLAEQMGSTHVFDEEIAELRAAAKTMLERIARDANEELDYLGPVITENADEGSFAALITADAVAAGWQRAKALLDAGITFDAVLELAKSERDAGMLAGLERNGPTWLRAAAGSNYDAASVKRRIAELRDAIEAATDADVAGSPAELYREARREYEKLARSVRAWINFGAIAVTGRATGADRIALGFEIGDVATAPEPLPFNGLVGDAEGVLANMEGAKGIGTTV
jgi:hypothetical protein